MIVLPSHSLPNIPTNRTAQGLRDWRLGRNWARKFSFLRDIHNEITEQTRTDFRDYGWIGWKGLAPE